MTKKREVPAKPDKNRMSDPVPRERVAFIIEIHRSERKLKMWGPKNYTDSKKVYGKLIIHPLKTYTELIIDERYNLDEVVEWIWKNAPIPKERDDAGDIAFGVLIAIVIALVIIGALGFFVLALAKG